MCALQGQKAGLAQRVHAFIQKYVWFLWLVSTKLQLLGRLASLGRSWLWQPPEAPQDHRRDDVPAWCSNKITLFIIIATKGAAQSQDGRQFNPDGRL